MYDPTVTPVSEIAANVPQTAANEPSRKWTQAEIDARREKRQREHVERHRRLAREAWQSAYVQRWRAACPPALQESDWRHSDLLPYRPHVDRVLSWQWGPRGILAAGDTGRGKSRCMWALMRRLCDEGIDVRMWSAQEWFARLNSMRQWERDYADEFVRDQSRVPVLFLDDWGQEAVMQSREQWMRQHWFRLLDLRAGNRLPLFVTTNLSARDLTNGTPDAYLRSDPMVRRLLICCEPIKWLPVQP